MSGLRSPGYNRGSMNAPLAGILVADLTQNVAGPFCTMILGDMGAEVVKVEEPGLGDDARVGALHRRTERYYLSVNRNKRSLVLDLKTRGGGRRRPR